LIRVKRQRVARRRSDVQASIHPIEESTAVSKVSYEAVPLAACSWPEV
jgi:hypothetical protein